MKAKKWILAKHFEGEPKEENLQLVEFDLSDDLKENGKLETFIRINTQFYSLTMNNFIKYSNELFIHYLHGRQ